MKNKVLFDNRRFVLTRHSKPRKKGHYYTIRVDYWTWRSRDDRELGAVRDHFDPNHNRGSEGGVTWKYKSKQLAEQLILLALIKWPK